MHGWYHVKRQNAAPMYVQTANDKMQPPWYVRVSRVWTVAMIKCGVSTSHMASNVEETNEATLVELVLIRPCCYVYMIAKMYMHFL